MATFISTAVSTSNPICGTLLFYDACNLDICAKENINFNFKGPFHCMSVIPLVLQDLKSVNCIVAGNLTVLVPR
jgi:hypothetical protein